MFSCNWSCLGAWIGWWVFIQFFSFLKVTQNRLQIFLQKCDFQKGITTTKWEIPVLTYLIFTISQWARYYCSCFEDEETEAQRRLNNCSRSCSQEVTASHSNLSSLLQGLFNHGAILPIHTVALVHLTGRYWEQTMEISGKHWNS